MTILGIIIIIIIAAALFGGIFCGFPWYIVIPGIIMGIIALTRD